MAAAVLLCGLSYLGLHMVVARGGSIDDVVLFTCAATLGLAIIAAVFSARSLSRANAVKREVAQMSRSVDAALRELSQRGLREAATLEELSALVTREMEDAPVRAPQRGRESGNRDNVVAISSQRRQKAEPIELPGPPVTAEQAGFEAAVRRAFGAGLPEISLQPIVSIAQGAATGFEVFAHVTREDGSGIDLQRLPFPLAELSQAMFERWLLLGALEAARKQLGADGLPLHVQISDALLSDSDLLAGTVDSLRKAGAVASSLVLSLPFSALDRADRQVEALDMLTDAGVRLAVEGWTGTKESLEKLKRTGASVVKLSSDRLLGRTKVTRSTPSPLRMVETAAAMDMPVVALNVATDEDAVSLIDLGVDLMTGNRFSGPRRLRPPGEARNEQRAQN